MSARTAPTAGPADSECLDDKEKRPQLRVALDGGIFAGRSDKQDQHPTTQ